MLNDVYNKKILAFAADIPRHVRLKDPDGTAVAHSRLCGSKVTVDVKMDGSRVADFGHEVKACALGQASSSIMARNVVGATAEELHRIRREMHAMLKENGPPPSGRWSDLEALLPVRDFKARHASTLLTFDAVCDAVDKAVKRSSVSPGAPLEESATAGRGS
jgi:NifU-like protein involved in Fe-S cluster formation